MLEDKNVLGGGLGPCSVAPRTALSRRLLQYRSGGHRLHVICAHR
jgi:uncharacterized protein (DUF2237 family)